MTAVYDLVEVDPWEAFTLADQRAEAEAAQSQSEFVITVHDNTATALGEIGDYISATVTFKRNAVGTGTVVLKGDDPFVPLAMLCKVTVILITVEANGYRWSGRIDTCADDTVNGVNTVTLQLVSDWNWFNKIMVWPNFAAPIQVQFPKEATFVGPAVTNIKELIAEQCIRLQLGLWEIVDNILDPAAWFGNVLNHEGLLTPIAVVPTNPLTDTSKWTAITCRMTSVAAAVEQTLKDCGLILTADLWKPGDPQPCPQWFILTEPTIVVDVKDKSNVTGLTGTALDGLIGEAVNVADTLLSEILGVVGGADVADQGGTDATNPYGDGILAQLLGFHSTPPWVIYEDGPRSGIRESHVTAHHPLAYTVIGGGKSPTWVNKGIDLLLEWLLSMLLATFGASGISSTLLDGVFDDVVLAFQQIEDEARRLQLGKFGYPEFFTSTGSAAYTLDELIALESALWDTRGYYSFSMVAQDAYPYSFGRDMVIGDPVSWIYKGVIYTDYLLEATLVDDRTHRVDLALKVGDGAAQESPWAKLARKYESLSSAVKAASLSQN